MGIFSKIKSFLQPNIVKFIERQDLEGLLTVAKADEQSFFEEKTRSDALEGLGIMFIAALKDRKVFPYLTIIEVFLKKKYFHAIDYLLNIINDDSYIEFIVNNIDMSELITILNSTSIDTITDQKMKQAVNKLEKFITIRDLAKRLAKRESGNERQLLNEIISYGSDAVPHLLSILYSEGGYVCEALGEIGDPRAVEPLIRLFIYRKKRMVNWEHPEDAALALAKIGDLQAVPPLLNAFNNGCEEYWLVQALAILGVPEVEETLENMIAHAGQTRYRPYAPEWARKSLTDALEVLQRKTRSKEEVLALQRRSILESLASDDVARRKAACYLSVAFHNQEIVAALIKALEWLPPIQYNQGLDVYQSSRKGAAFALGKIGDSATIPVLLKAMALDATLSLAHSMVFGTSVFEGLKEADTDFARAVLAK
jgi:HEAT repeat protein